MLLIWAAHEVTNIIVSWFQVSTAIAVVDCACGAGGNFVVSGFDAGGALILLCIEAFSPGGDFASAVETGGGFVAEGNFVSDHDQDCHSFYPLLFWQMWKHQAPYANIHWQEED